MKFNARKGLAVILALVLVLCMMPVSVFAAEKLTYEGDTVKHSSTGILFYCKSGDWSFCC